MEVHHHPHTPRKKWTHYFWEFLMLFIAVFCGFLAENIREHTVEHFREKQYIKSFSEDLAADTIEFENRISACWQTITLSDSMILLLNRPDRDKYANDIYYFSRQIHRSNEFSTNDRTIVQLRNAGGMRLIKNKEVSDSIVSYYKTIDMLRYIYEEQIDHKRNFRSHLPEILDGFDYGKIVDSVNRVVRINETLHLKITNPNAINTLMLILQNIKGINQGIKRRLNELKIKATTIREFILREYHIKRA